MSGEARVKEGGKYNENAVKERGSRGVEKVPVERWMSSLRHQDNVFPHTDAARPWPHYSDMRL